jgi:hypothetical protein
MCIVCSFRRLHQLQVADGVAKGHARLVARAQRPEEIGEHGR